MSEPTEARQSSSGAIAQALQSVPDGRLRRALGSSVAAITVASAAHGQIQRWRDRRAPIKVQPETVAVDLVEVFKNHPGDDFGAELELRRMNKVREAS